MTDGFFQLDGHACIGEFMKKFRFSLKIKLTALMLLVSFTFILIQGITALLTSTKAVDESVQGRLSAIADDVADQIADNNEKNFMAIRVVALLPELRSNDVPLLEKCNLLTSVAKEMGSAYENLGYYDSQAKSYTRDGRVLDFSDRDYIMQALQGNEVILDPFVSPVTNTLMMQYITPVRDYNNQVIGCITMILNGNPLQYFCKAIDLGGDMHPSVMSRKTGKTIAFANSSDNSSSEDDGKKVDDIDETQGIGLVLSHVMQGLTGNESFIDPASNAEIISSYRPIEGTDWAVFCAAPYDYYYGRLENLKKIMSAILILSMIFISVLCVTIITVLFKPLIKVRDAIFDLSSGNADLTQRLRTTSNDEIGDVVAGVNKFIEKLQEIMKALKESKVNLETVSEDLSISAQDASASITEITANIESVNNQIMSQSTSVNETAGAVNEISSNIESLERMIESQSSGVTQASATVEQMIGNINSVNKTVEKMVSSFNLLEQNTNTGISTQENVNEKIKQIEDESNMLQDANSVISNIAEQTNLLAMNAAIEAAHAGEAGKGFSVVADEIRKLSETSTAQSKQIGENLNRIQNTIETVVSSSKETNTAFTSVSKNISDTSLLIQQIRAAMEEQQVGSKQIIEALQSMNNSTSEVKNASAEMTRGNEQILKEVTQLKEATDTMKGSVSEMQTGAVKINETGSALSEISGKVTESIKNIGGQVDMFKV